VLTDRQTDRQANTQTDITENNTTMDARVVDIRCPWLARCSE